MSNQPKDIPSIIDASPQLIKDIALYIKRNFITEDYIDKDTYYEKIYPRFKKKYPTLYDLSCSNAIEIGEFNKMLSIIITKFQQQQDGVLDKQKSSEQVGIALFNQYVKTKEHLMKKTDNST